MPGHRGEGIDVDAVADGIIVTAAGPTVAIHVDLTVVEAERLILRLTAETNRARHMAADFQARYAAAAARRRNEG